MIQPSLGCPLPHFFHNPPTPDYLSHIQQWIPPPLPPLKIEVLQCLPPSLVKMCHNSHFPSPNPETHHFFSRPPHAPPPPFPLLWLSRNWPQKKKQPSAGQRKWPTALASKYNKKTLGIIKKNSYKNRQRRINEELIDKTSPSPVERGIYPSNKSIPATQLNFSQWVNFINQISWSIYKF